MSPATDEENGWEGERVPVSLIFLNPNTLIKSHLFWFSSLHEKCFLNLNLIEAESGLALTPAFSSFN